MLPQIIGLVGPIRAGKTTVGAYLSKRYGYRPASNSELLRAIAAGLELNPDRQNLKKLGDAIFSTLGNETLARYRLSRPEDFPIVIDGIRYPEEISAYSQLPSFRLIGITAKDEQRYDRAMALAHQGKDSYLSAEAFGLLSNARSEKSIPELMSLAHCLIVNDEGIDGLERAIDSAMLRWKDCL